MITFTQFAWGIGLLAFVSIGIGFATSYAGSSLSFRFRSGDIAAQVILQETVNNLSQQVQDYQERIASQSATNDSLRREVAGLKDMVGNQQETIQKLQSKVSKLEEDSKVKDRIIERLEERIINERRDSE